MKANPQQHLIDMIEHAALGASLAFLKRKALRPMYDAVCADGQHLLIPAPPTDKDTGIAMIKALFELRDVIEYVFMDEAWVVATSDQKVMAHAIKHGATESPARRESLMFLAEDRTGLLIASRWIERLPNGEVGLAPLVFDFEHGQFRGRMCGLLPRTSTVQ